MSKKQQAKNEPATKVESSMEGKMGNKVKKDFATLVNTMESRIKELEEKENHWAMLETMMEEHASKTLEKITLDIGGQKFATSKTTLLSHKGSFFDAMLTSGKWKPDTKGRYFIDRNPELFPVILDYLRTGKVTLKRYNYDVKDDLKTELDFYLIDIPDKLLKPYKVLTSAYEEKIKEWTGKSTLSLLYRGSRDGFAANIFHSKCDNKGPTVTILKSTGGYVFGGYSTVPWESTGQYKRAPGSFLFTLSNPHNVAPTTFHLNNSYANDIFCNPGYGPTFGGHDLLINNNCNLSNCAIKFPHSYTDTVGHGYAIFVNAQSFLVSDIEVFLIQ